MAKQAFITIGISASGKTTWAEEYIENATKRGETVINLNRDNARNLLMEEKGLEPLWKNWKWKWEDKVTEMIDEAKAWAIQHGYDIVFSDTNLNPHRVKTLYDELQSLGYTVEMKYFDVSYDEAVRRDSERANGVGPWVIAKQYEQWCEHYEARPVNADHLPSVILVDIDGTVALMKGRSPFEWTRVHEDVDHAIVVSIVKGLQAQGKQIVFFSGRDGSCYQATKQWLEERFGPSSLYMRTAGDQRNDAIVKEEMYKAFIAGKFHVEAVIDDRPRVCKMWRRLGFNVIQIGNPYVDF